MGTGHLELQPGLKLSHYILLEKIGEGGMGAVYRARDERLQRDVALKVLHAGLLGDPKARDRLRKEALILSSLSHPHIASVHDLDSALGVDFAVMELVPGPAISDKLKAGPLAEIEVARLGAQLADGLAVAHAQGVVHRDLKPGNLRLTPDGRLKILDFGLAHAARPVSETDTTVTSAGARAPSGTLPYMAPELLRGAPADARSDVYAAGAALYEMATGQRPFAQPQASLVIDAVLNQEPVAPRAVNRRVSPSLERIILKALDKEPDRRYQSARELQAELESLAGGAQRPAAARARSRRAILVAGLASAAVVLGGLLAFDAGGVRSRLLSPSRPWAIDSIAVLPLQHPSTDPNHDDLSDGMTDVLIAELTRIGALRVISPFSAFRYKGTTRPAPEIGRELDVEALVGGSVRREGNRVQITVFLIHAPTDRNLWAATYERDLNDPLALQGEVARAIAREVQVTLTPPERERLSGRRRVSPEAYDLYLRGRARWNRRDAASMKQALEYFQQATSVDPGYALAWAGIADCYTTRGGSYLGLSEKEAFARAREAAARALDLDESLGEAHASMAAVKEWDWDWAGAGRDLDRAVDLNPGYATARQYRAEYLSHMGRDEEAIAEGMRARGLDPLSPVINTVLGWVYYRARRHDEAIRQYRAALEIDPAFILAEARLHDAYWAQGRHEEARAAAQRLLELGHASTETVSDLEKAYATSGARGALAWWLDYWNEAARRGPVPPYLLAQIHAALGDAGQAFGWLEKAYESHSYSLAMLKGDPYLDSLRSDPRFEDLRRRVGLPP